MSRLATWLLVAAIAIGFGGSTFAQDTASQKSTTPATTRAERAEAAKAKRAEMAQKRTDCEKQANEQKLHLLKRARFIHNCLHEENK
jgi:uncharacterized protein HemX